MEKKSYMKIFNWILTNEIMNNFMFSHVIAGNSQSISMYLVKELPLTQKKFLIDLDDDCLLYIFSYLTLKDQLALVKSHDRFTALFDLAGIKEINTDQLKDMSLWQMRAFLKIAGQKLEKFVLKKNFEHKNNKIFCQLITSYCSNLKKIRLEDTYWSRDPMEDEQFNNLLSPMPKLTTLCIVGLWITDKCFNVLSKLPRLQQLYMRDCNKITGAELKLLTSLKKLSLIYCHGIISLNLETALIQMPKLYALCLIDSLNVRFLQKLSTICSSLEVLYISSANEYVGNLVNLKSIYFEDIADFELTKFLQKKTEQIESLGIDRCEYLNEKHNLLIKQLSNLTILHCNNVNDESLKAFTALKKLIELKICCSNSITSNALFELVRSCASLKWLNIRRTSINNDFAISILSFISVQRPLIVLAYGSKMKMSENFPQEFKKKTYIRFVFEDVQSLRSYDNLSDSFHNIDSLGTAPFFSHFLFYPT